MASTSMGVPISVSPSFASRQRPVAGLLPDAFAAFGLQVWIQSIFAADWRNRRAGRET